MPEIELTAKIMTISAFWTNDKHFVLVQEFNWMYMKYILKYIIQWYVDQRWERWSLVHLAKSDEDGYVENENDAMRFRSA